MKELIDRFYFYLENIGSKKNTFLVLPIILVFVSLLSAFPSYDNLVTAEFSESWNAILRQSENPFTPHVYASESHAANLAFRITPVIIGNALGLTSVIDYIVLQILGLILLFVVTTRLFIKILGKGAVSLLFSSSISFIFIGNVLCSDYRGFFDVLAFLFISISLFSEIPLIIFASSLIGFYTDERALIASSLIYIFFVVERDFQFNSTLNLKNFFRLNNKMTALLIAWIAYFVIRAFMSYKYGLNTNSKGMFDYLISHGISHINAIPIGIWTGLEGLWVTVGVSLIILIARKNWTILFIYLGAQALVILIALWTFDITRSMAYLLPTIFVSLLLLIRSESTNVIKYIAIITFLLCSLPTYYLGGPNTINWFYPLPLQVVRMLFL